MSELRHLEMIFPQHSQKHKQVLLTANSLNRTSQDRLKTFAMLLKFHTTSKRVKIQFKIHLRLYSFLAFGIYTHSWVLQQQSVSMSLCSGACWPPCQSRNETLLNPQKRPGRGVKTPVLLCSSSTATLDPVSLLILNSCFTCDSCSVICVSSSLCSCHVLMWIPP